MTYVNYYSLDRTIELCGAAFCVRTSDRLKAGIVLFGSVSSVV
jgi:hypothetical protein